MADRKGFVGVRFDEATLALIDRQAKESAVSRSVIIRMAVEVYLAEVCGNPGAETPPQRLITPDSTEVDAAVARHPAGKRRHNGKRTDLRTAGSCHGCRDCTGWSPIVAGGMRCKCGHPVHMH